eukprot:scaffold229113_cov26-Tisochrysis_lutea.AAC.5
MWIGIGSGNSIWDFGLGANRERERGSMGRREAPSDLKTSAATTLANNNGPSHDIAHRTGHATHKHRSNKYKPRNHWVLYLGSMLELLVSCDMNDGPGRYVQ